ncbi:hypothetical protein OKW35_001375 [Paraburkholderia sp. MM5477-R1]
MSGMSASHYVVSSEREIFASAKNPPTGGSLMLALLIESEQRKVVLQLASQELERIQFLHLLSEKRVKRRSPLAI